MKKHLIVTVLSLLLLFSSLFVITACKKDNYSGCEIKIESEDFVDGYTFEYTGKGINLPSCILINTSTGKTVSYDVKYIVFDKDEITKIAESEYPNFDLNVGSYVIKYYFNSKIEKSICFNVALRTGPEITFSGIPASLFYNGESFVEYLPNENISCLTEFDKTRSLTFTPFGGDEETRSFTADKEYEIDGSGTFKYTISATDIYGNNTIETASWLVKDANWVPENTLDLPVLANYDEEGYINTVRAGTGDGYSVIGDNYTNEWLDSFEGADGVLKIKAGFTDQNYNSIKLSLPTSFRISEMGDDEYLAVRIYIDSIENISSSLIFYGTVEEQHDAETRVERQFVSGITAGNWQTIYISKYIVNYIKMYSENDNDIVNSLQIGFRRNSVVVENITYYIDNISLVKKLNSPVLVSNGSLLSWNEVENATSYVVDVDGVETTTNATSFTLPEDFGYVKVIACGDCEKFVESEPKIFIPNLDEKYIVNFDDELYKHLFSRDTDFADDLQNEGYKPQYMSFTQTNNGLQVVAGISSWGVVTGFKLLFPQELSVDAKTSKLVLNLSISGTVFNTLRIFDYSGHNLLTQLNNIQDLLGQDTKISIDLSSFVGSSLQGLNFIFGQASCSGVTVTIKNIHTEYTLSTPTGFSEDRNNHMVIWNAVDYANNYCIILNGVVVKDNITDTYFDYNTLVTDEYVQGTICVMAVGNGISVLNSNYTKEIYIDTRTEKPELTGFSISEGNLVWEALGEKKTAYEVKVGSLDSETILVNNEVFNLNGENLIYVRSIYTGSTYANSSWVCVKITGNTAVIVNGYITSTAKSGNLTKVDLTSFVDENNEEINLSLTGQISYGGSITIDGESVNDVNFTFENNVLSLNGSFVSDKVITITAGTVIYDIEGKGYIFGKDISFVYVGLSWQTYAGEIDLSLYTPQSWGDGVNKSNLPLTSLDTLLFEGDPVYFTEFTISGNCYLNGAKIVLQGAYAKNSDKNTMKLYGFNASVGNVLSLNDMFFAGNGYAYSVKPISFKLYESTGWVVAENKGVRQLGGIDSSESNELTINADLNLNDGDVGFTAFKINGIDTSYTAIYSDSKLTINLLSDYADGTALTIELDSWIIVGDEFVSISKEFFAVKSGNSWVTITGKVNFGDVAGDSSSIFITLSGMDLDVGVVDANSLTITGASISGAEIVKESGVTKLKLTFENSVSDKTVLTLVAGSLIMSGDNTYSVAANASFYLVGDTWNKLTNFVLGAVGYNTSTVIQINCTLGFEAEEGNEWVNSVKTNSNMEIVTSNCTVNYSNQMRYNTHNLLCFDGNFGAQKGSTITIKKGSIIGNGTIYYILSSDYKLKYNGSNWVKN